MLQSNLDIKTTFWAAVKVVFILRGQRMRPGVHQMDFMYKRNAERAALKVVFMARWSLYQGGL